MKETEAYLQRKIIHVDMDAFYASVEQRDFPELKGKPVAVGGGGDRGVLTTASYEARIFGVKSAMPGFIARQKCPHLIFQKPRFEVYQEVAIQIRQIFEDYTSAIEPLSLDEAYLDVTDNTQFESATAIAQDIRRRIKEELNLTCSAGISYCKFLAKIASDVNKPNGYFIIRPDAAQNFMKNLPIERFFGIGKVSADKLKRMNINKGKDLLKYSDIQLAQWFGKQGVWFYKIVRGIDKRPVESGGKRKSIGVERTYKKDHYFSDLDQTQEHMDFLIQELIRRAEKASDYGRCITIKLKTIDFKVYSRSQTHLHAIKNPEEIRSIALDLLDRIKESQDNYRLLGLQMSQLESAEQDQFYEQLKLEFIG